MTSLVLVVDDEEMTRNLLRIMLERDGFAIVQAADGEEALEMVRNKQPDIVIMDVMMPNMDGLTCCERLRGQPETADLPIILLSARTQSAAVQAGMDAGANYYMTKPISRPELVETINQLLAAVPASHTEMVAD